MVIILINSDIIVILWWYTLWQLIGNIVEIEQYSIELVINSI